MTFQKRQSAIYKVNALIMCEQSPQYTTFSFYIIHFIHRKVSRVEFEYFVHTIIF